MRNAILALTVLVMPIAASAADHPNSYRTTTDAKMIGWMDQGMDAVREKLKDPKSADFKDVYFNRGRDGIPMTCGKVNAKNSFGGRGGYQRFISAGRLDLTYLEEEVADFGTAWKQFCR